MGGSCEKGSPFCAGNLVNVAKPWVEVQESLFFANNETTHANTNTENHHHQHQQVGATVSESRNNDLLDKENNVVVEILSESELMALEEWWPEIHSSFIMKFAVLSDDSANGSNSNIITWSTPPCRECDACHCSANVVVRNRSRKWAKKVKK